MTGSCTSLDVKSETEYQKLSFMFFKAVGKKSETRICLLCMCTMKKNFFLKDITAYKKLMQQFADGG